MCLLYVVVLREVSLWYAVYLEERQTVGIMKHRRKEMNFEFDSDVFDALVVERQETILAKEKKKKRQYPLYRNYPNGSKQYYERLCEEENQKLFFEEKEEAPEIKVSILASMGKEIKCIQKDCVKEFKNMFKSLVKNPYF